MAHVNVPQDYAAKVLRVGINIRSLIVRILPMVICCSETRKCQAGSLSGSFLSGAAPTSFSQHRPRERLRYQMRRIAFPFRLNIGTDIVHLPRIHRLISQNKGRSLLPFAKRILHPLELRDLSRRHPNWQDQRETTYTSSDNLVRWLGGRFAAKEAARKAMGATTLGWKDVRVEIGEPSGEPRIVCASRNVDKEEHEHEARLSISHDGDYVTATVLTAVPAEMNGNGHDKGSA